MKGIWHRVQSCRRRPRYVRFCWRWWLCQNVRPETSGTFNNYIWG